MGSEFEIRNIRKFDDDLKRICVCYAARVESMEISQSACHAAFAIARELRYTYQHARHRKKYFADYKDASTGTGVERYNLPPAEVDANTFAAALMPAMLGASPLPYWRTRHHKSCHKCPPKWNYTPPVQYLAHLAFAMRR